MMNLLLDNFCVVCRELLVRTIYSHLDRLITGGSDDPPLLEEGQSIVVRTTAPSDVDLYLRFGQAPTTSAYDLRGYTVSGDETLEFTASMAGTLHIGVHGWTASDFTLATSDD